MPVGEMLSRMSSRELTEWIAFSRIEPFTAERTELAIAILATVTVNMWSGKGGTKPKPGDFMIDWDKVEAREPQTVETMKGIAKSWAAMFSNKKKAPNGNDSKP